MSTSFYDLRNDYLSALDFFTDPEQDLLVEAVNDSLECLEGQIQEKSISGQGVTQYGRNGCLTSIILSIMLPNKGEQK